MAWYTNGSSTYLTVTDDAALTLPSGDWTVGGWIKVISNAGSAYQYPISWGTFDASPSLNFYINEASVSNPGKLIVNIRNSNGDRWTDATTGLTSLGSPGSSNDWWHVIVRKSGTTMQLFIDGVADTSGSNPSALAVDINVSGNLYLGSRSYSPANRWFNGNLADWFKVNRALSTNEIKGLSNGLPAGRLNGIYGSTSWYLPMATPTYAEYSNQLSVTNSGSTQADHPPLAVFKSWLSSINPFGGSSGVTIPVFTQHLTRLWRNS